MVNVYALGKKKPANEDIFQMLGAVPNSIYQLDKNCKAGKIYITRIILYKNRPAVKGCVQLFEHIGYAPSAERGVIYPPLKSVGFPAHP